MQGVVEPRDRARRIAERGMGRDVIDTLAVDVDLAAILEDSRDIPRP